MPICSICCAIATVASLKVFPGARLNEIVLAMNGPWWLTANGVLPLSITVNADSGTIVSRLVLTAEPADVPARPVVASALIDALRAELPAMAAAVVGAALVRDAAVNVPTTALDSADPDAAPPAVLT